MLWDLIARPYKALGEEQKRLLDDYFGAGSSFMTANYGHIMRWICKRMSSLRPQIVTNSRVSKEKYDYRAAPEPLVVIDGVESKNIRIEVPWHAIPFDKEMREWGYNPGSIAFVDPKTSSVIDLTHLRSKAYENTFSRSYDRVVVAINKADAIDVYLDRQDRQFFGNFWGTNTTVGDIKTLADFQDRDLLFGNRLCDDHSTLSSLSQGSNFVSFVTSNMIPVIHMGNAMNPLHPRPTDLFSSVIDYIERIYPGTKLILPKSGCQPPRNMMVKDVVKLFGNWRDGTLEVRTTRNYARVVLCSEEHHSMNVCEPLVITFADKEVPFQTIVDEFVRRIPSIRMAYMRIENENEEEEEEEEEKTLKWEHWCVSQNEMPEMLTKKN